MWRLLFVLAPCGSATLIQAASARASMISLCCLGIMQTGEGMSKPSAAITLFHEMKFAVVARLFEGRSPEFQSHRRMNPWNRTH